jgi:hypothetical protein
LKIKIFLVIITAAVLTMTSCRPFEIMRDRITETSMQEETAETTPTTEAAAVETTQEIEEQPSYPKNLEETRDYFVKGVSFFEEGSYIEAQYYMSKLLNSYPLMRDYVLYYMAKSTLLENKFEVSEGYYEPDTGRLSGEHMV